MSLWLYGNWHCLVTLELQAASLTFSVILLISLVMGIVLNFTMFWCTIVNSALTTTIVGVLKGVGSTVSLPTSVWLVWPLIGTLDAIELRSFLELISKSYIIFSPLAFQTLGFVLLGGVEVHALNVTGLVINTFGGVWYSYAKYKQKKKTPRKIQHDVESHAHK